MSNIQFWRSNQMSDDSFLDLVKRTFGKTFTKGIDAKNWLITNGYYTSYPDIVTDGLVLYLDAANSSSFKGEPTTNLLSNPSLNGYPTYGNTWGTYNTNQYGSGTYWSIGTTISDVTNNIVTTTSAHPFRTYDVLRPQTTGGGLTAETDYFVKKLSSTSFTLHQYNSSQDGSQGYINPLTGNHKVYDSIANDIRISVNATNFPLMWWGAPHQPNSGLVKEIIPKGYNHISDCIRLHYIREDNVLDGMSYGADANNLTIGVPHTLSFYTRSVTPSAVGKSCSCQIYNYDAYFSTGFVLGELNVWTKNTLTFTPTTSTNAITYWFPETGQYKYDIANIQYEQKSYSTPFVAGTRGTTYATGGGWCDLSGNGNHGELVNGPLFNSSNLGSVVFDGINDLIKIPTNPSYFFNNNFTQMAWVNYVSDKGTYAGIFWGEGALGEGSGYQMLLSINGVGSSGSYFHTRVQNATTGWSNTDISIGYSLLNTWTHIAWSFDNGTTKIYINGQVFNTDTSRGIYNGGTTSPFFLGGRNDGALTSNMKMSNVYCYNRVLSDSEIAQNFNATKEKFGL